MRWMAKNNRLYAATGITNEGSSIQILTCHDDSLILICDALRESVTSTQAELPIPINRNLKVMVQSARNIMKIYMFIKLHYPFIFCDSQFHTD
mgnify:CR=1 FL=1